MSSSILNILSALSAICGVTAFILFFLTIPARHRRICFLVSSVLLGIPVLLLVVEQGIWLFSVSLVIFAMSVALFAFYFGKTKAEDATTVRDIEFISNRRTSGQDWIVENLLSCTTGVAQIDVYGVKIEALYKVIKGATYKSKLPQDLAIKMRVLFLEPNSVGAVSRSIIEKNDKILRDVELMKDVWAKIEKEYKKHPTHTLKVRMFQSTPSFYIIRVNDRMLVGMYLAESGYENLSFHLIRSDGSTFSQFERFFERIWADHSRSVSSNKASRQTMT